MFPFRSIRARLTVTFTVGIALLLVAANVGLMAYSRQSAGAQTNRQLGLALERLRAALNDEFDEAGEPDRNRARILTQPAVAAAAIRDTRAFLAEEQVSALIQDSSGASCSTEDGAIINAPNVISDAVFAPLRQSGWRIRSARIGNSEHSVSYTVYVAFPWSRTLIQLRHQAELMGTLSAFVILVTAVGTWLLVGRTLMPIDRLVQQVRRHSGQHSHLETLRLSPPSRDAEVVRLVATVNELLDGIAESAAARGRFYAAASHELRTPLHVLAGQAELTLSRPRSADEYRTALETVQRQADRLIGLSESLLLLNRLDRAIPDTTPRESVDLASVCQEVLAEQEPLTVKNGIVVSTNFAVSQMFVSAPCAPVEILVRNLITNAIRYTTVGGKVRIELDSYPSANRGATQRKLTIYNDAPPLSMEDTGRLLEPFFRPDASRTSQSGGNGLGLSICRALAEVNGWRLSLRPENGGFLAVVEFGDGLPGMQS